MEQIPKRLETKKENQKAVEITYQTIRLAFAAGCLGGLAKGPVAWLFGAIGLNALLGSQFAPPLATQWVYTQLASAFWWKPARESA